MSPRCTFAATGAPPGHPVWLGVWLGVAGAMARLAICIGLVSVSPMLARGHENGREDTPEAPSREPTPRPSAADIMGRPLTVVGEIEIVPNEATGESDVLVLQTPMGSMILEGPAANQELRDHLGETFEVTGTLSGDQLGGGTVLRVEHYRAAQGGPTDSPGHP